MPSFARASFEDSFGVRAGAMDDYPPQYTKHHLRGRSIKSSSSLFFKAHGRHGVKESWISQQQQQFQQFQQLQQLQHWQEPDYLERKSTSSSLVSSISNGRASDAPPTTDTSKQRDLESGLPPPLTREEFEALPVAIQRKYFSTLERLRFAQSSGGVDGIFKHYCETSKRSSPRPDKGVVEPSTGRRRRLSLRTTTNDTLDTDVFTLTDTLPGRSQRHRLTREEQVALARNLRASVLLDAADEAVGRARRRASTTFTSDYGTSICSPDRLSMESMRCELPDVAMNQSDARSTRPESFCDSFRWLDDDEDLDLRLFLSDYHANLRDTLPQPTKDHRHQHQHPSFRRHMSISKIPFGRSSASSSRPGTKDASTPTSPLQNPTSAPTSTSQHARRRSRTLSLITSRHAASESRETLPPIDPAAAHYQDPEARLKLRVFLASPQKFDEAIAFGFPSTDPRAPPSVPVKDIVVPPSSSHSRQQSSRAAAPGKLETFLADFDEDDNESDDKLSYSDQISAADPESPRTPHSTTDKSMIRPMRLPSVPSPDEYGQAPGSSREMTLKMTLTRPDLRATEDQIYGWKQHGAYSVRKSPSAGGRDDMFPPTLPGEKDGMDRNPGGLDHWGPPQDHNVMKRIWNRVRRS